MEGYEFKIEIVTVFINYFFYLYDFSMMKELTIFVSSPFEMILFTHKEP